MDTFKGMHCLLLNSAIINRTRIHEGAFSFCVIFFPVTELFPSKLCFFYTFIISILKTYGLVALKCLGSFFKLPLAIII